MQLEVIQSRVSTLVVKENPKSGAITARLMSQKEYCAAHSLKGNAGKRKHKEYLRENGALMSGAIAAQVASGVLVAQKARMSKSGDWAVTYVPKHKLETSAGDKTKAIQDAANKQAEERVTTMLEEKAAALAKQLNCTIEVARGYVGLN